jgi:WD40 repeat protein
MSSFKTICHQEPIVSLTVFVTEKSIEASIREDLSLPQQDDDNDGNGHKIEFKNTYALTTSTDNTAIVWNINSGRAIKQIKLNSDVLSAVIFKPDSTFGSSDPVIILGCGDGTIYSFLVYTSSVETTCLVDKNLGLTGIRSIAICAENRSDFGFGLHINHNAFLTAGLDDGSVITISLQKREVFKFFKHADGNKSHEESCISVLVISLDNTTHVISGGNDKRVIAWKMSNLWTSNISSPAPIKLSGLSSKIQALVAVDPYVVIGLEDGGLVLWDMLTESPIWTLSDKKQDIINYMFVCKMFGKLTLLSSSIDSICAWDVQDIEKTKSLHFLKKIYGKNFENGLHVLLPEDADDHALPTVISVSNSTSITSVKLLPFTQPIGLFGEIKDNLQKIIDDFGDNSDMITKLFLMNKQLLFIAVNESNAKLFESYKKEIAAVIHTLGYEQITIDPDNFEPTPPQSFSCRPITSESIDYEEIKLASPKKRSLLKCAIDKGDLTTLVNVLNCWTLAISSHVPKFSNYFHPSYFLLKEDLLALSVKFPEEFRDFVVGFDYINVHPSVVLHPSESDGNSTPISSSKALLVRGANRVQRHIWSSHYSVRRSISDAIQKLLGIKTEFTPGISKRESVHSQVIYGLNYIFYQDYDIGHQQDMSAKMLAVTNAADIDMLLAFVSVCDALGTEIFASTMLQAR